jgi:ankyrin repeat protein
MADQLHLFDIQKVRDHIVAIIRSRNYCVSPLVIEAIVKKHAKATISTNADGWAPLHVACAWGAPAAIVELLIDGGPNSKAAKMITSGGCTPLHLACQTSSTTVETISILVNAYPNAIATVNSGGETPLHRACFFLRESPEAIECLLNSCPTHHTHTHTHSTGSNGNVSNVSNVLGMRDEDGCTPLHVLASSCNDLVVLEQMVGMYPTHDYYKGRDTTALCL